MTEQEQHEQHINSMISEAEALAQLRMNGIEVKSESRPDGHGGVYTHFFASQFFHEEMNKLAFEAGLRSYN